MGIFDVFALAVIGYIIIEVVKAWKGNGSSLEDITDELLGSGFDESKKVKALNEEIASLKDRVATLEAIVTDEKYQLKKEIETL